MVFVLSTICGEKRFSKVLWFRDFQSLRVSTKFTAPHKIIDRLYQNRVFLDRLYLDRVYFDRVYRLPPQRLQNRTAFKADYQALFGKNVGART